MEKAKGARGTAVEYKLSGQEAQPLMILEYLNSWGNEFLFIFLIIAAGFLLLFVNVVELPESVTTIFGFTLPSYWATHVPIFVLIIAALSLAVYYNMRRRYIEGMMFMLLKQVTTPQRQRKAKR